MTAAAKECKRAAPEDESAAGAPKADRQRVRIGMRGGLSATIDCQVQPRLGRHDVALLLLDPGLPGDSGLELLRLLDAEQSNLPVIVLSASELNLEHSPRVRAVLVKSRTSEASIVQTILDVLGLE